MNLLEEVIEACGGMRRWRQVEHFTAHLSIQGALLARKGRAGLLTDIVVEGCVQRQVLQIPSFTAPDRRAYYHPERVAIERSDGTVLAERHLGSTFEPHAKTEWDDLDVAHYCGLWSWSALTEPFRLADPAIQTEELAACSEAGERWRRLRVTPSAGASALFGTRIFYFDPNGLQRRIGHDPAMFGGASVAQRCWAHHEFSGIVIPTLHQFTGVNVIGTLVESDGPDIELFDATYE